MKALASAALALALLMPATPATAHALDVTTARVSLRDRHLEVVVDVDAVRLIRARAGDAGDASTVAAASEEQLAAWVAAARADIEDGAHLTAEGAASRLVLRAFPVPAEVRLLAARQAGAPSAHPMTSTLRFESLVPVPRSRSLSVSLSKQLGRVLFTFVQPTTELAAPGAAASFEVLVSGSTEQSASSMSYRHWLAVTAAVLATFALLAQLSPRRLRASRSEERTA